MRQDAANAPTWSDWWQLHQWRLMPGRPRSSPAAWPKDPAPAAFLLEVLRTERHFLPRAAAALALGKMGHREAEGLLERLLQTAKAHPFARESAAVALGMLNDADGLGLLAQVLTDESAGIRLRVHAAIGLGLCANADVVPLLLRCLNRRGPAELHAACTIALARFPGQVEPLLAIARASKILPPIRAVALSGLGRQGDHYARTGAVLALLASRLAEARFSVEESRSAALAVRWFRLPEAVRVLRNAARGHADYVTRGYAMLSLAELLETAGTDAEAAYAASVMSVALENGARPEHPFAAVALGLLGRRVPGCAEPVRPLLLGGTEADSAAAAVGLGLMRDTQSIPLMAQAIQTRERTVVGGYACIGLSLLAPGSLHVQRHLTGLVRRVHAPELKAAAILALAQTPGGPDWVETAGTAIQDRNRYFKQNALLAAGNRRDPAMLPLLMAQYRRETNAECRAVVVTAIGCILDLAPRPSLREVAMWVEPGITMFRWPALRDALSLY